VVSDANLGGLGARAGIPVAHTWEPPPPEPPWIITAAPKSLGILAAALSVLGGCQTAGSFFLSFVGLEKKPLAVAVVMDPKPTAAVIALRSMSTHPLM